MLCVLSVYMCVCALMHDVCVLYFICVLLL